MRKTKSILLISFLMLLLGCSKQEPDVYLFSFFKGNGEDGFNWTALNNNKSFLTPEVGRDKLMRDPCIIIGGDNKFHMVWTVRWNEKGIGYASSPDKIHFPEGTRHGSVFKVKESVLNIITKHYN